MWAYFALQLRERVLSRPYYLLAGGMAAVLAAKSWLSANWYDNAKYSTFSDSLRAFFPNYWVIAPFKTYSADELNGQYFPLGKGRYSPLK